MTPAPKHSQRDALSNDTHFGVTTKCNSSRLSSVSDKPYGEPLQRGSIRQGEQAQITMATEAAMQAHDIYSQDSKAFPETLAQLAHVHFQKKLFLNNQNEFLFEGKAGMDGVGVLDTPSTSTGN